MRAGCSDVQAAMRSTPLPASSIATPLTRRGFLRVSMLATLAGGARAAGGAEAGRPRRESDEEILGRCQERIRQHRQGEAVVRVRDAQGRPVTGARVTVEQTAHEYLFGCNGFQLGRLGEAGQEADYRRRFAELFNFATLGFYWASYEPRRGEPEYARTDRAVDWCRTQGIRCKGHPLVWDHQASSPRWLPEDDAEIGKLSLGRVREIVARFKGRIAVWDVVNEPTHLLTPPQGHATAMNRWASRQGAVPYVRTHLETARAVAAPGATLLVNDYRPDREFYGILDALRADGRRLFDAVGIQSHMHDGCWPLARVWAVCDDFARLGLPVHFTETTLVSGPRLGAGENWGATTPELEARQAEAAARFYTALFAHPATAALTWWDFSDRGAWQGAAAGLVRRDVSPKPVFERLKALIKGEWWTTAEGRTDGVGEFKTRAFAGRHRVTVELPSGGNVTRELRVERERLARVEIEDGGR